MKLQASHLTRRLQAGIPFHQTLCRAAFLMLAATAGTAAQAQTYTWNGGTSDYNTATNWTVGTLGGTPPPDTNTESANFSTTTGATTVNVSASTTTQNLLFTATAPAYTFTASAGATLILDENIAAPTASQGIVIAATNPNLQTFALPMALRNSAASAQNLIISAGAGGVLFTAASSLDLTTSSTTATNTGVTPAFAGAGATTFNGSIAFGSVSQQFNFSGSNSTTANTVVNTFNPTTITAVTAAGAAFRLRITTGTLNIANNYAVTVAGVAQTTGTVEAGSASGSALAGNIYLTFANTDATPFVRQVRLGSNGGTGGTVAFGANVTGGGTTFASGGILLNSTASSTVTQQLFANAGTTLTESGAITGGSPASTAATTTLQILGGGTTVLSGANTYTSATSVTAGTLLVNGTHLTATGTAGTGTVGIAPGAYTVSNRATLGGTGNGTTSGLINTGANAINIGNGTTGGIITAGTVGTVGLLTLTTTNTNGVFFNGAAGSLSTYNADITSAGVDRLAITGLLNLSGTNDQIALNNISTLANGTYQLATYTSISGTFDSVTGLAANESLVYNANGTELDLVVGGAVPEPSTWVGAGVLCLALLGRGFRNRRTRA